MLYDACAKLMATLFSTCMTLLLCALANNKKNYQGITWGDKKTQ